MSNVGSAIAEAPADWSVNPRGYISGGSEDTPVFLEVKKKFNAARTRLKNKNKKSLAYGIVPADEIQRLSFSEIQSRVDKYWKTHDFQQYVQPVAIFGDPGFNKPEPHPIKES